MVGRRHEMLAEAVEIIRALWAGGMVTHQGNHFEVERARVWDLPDSSPPIGIAVSGPASCRLAGQRADVMIAVEPRAELGQMFDAARPRRRPGPQHVPAADPGARRDRCLHPRGRGARGTAFAVAAGVLFAVLAVLWLLAARGDRPEYRRSSRLFVGGTAACAVLLAGSALLPASARVPAWGLIDAAYFAGLAAVILTATPTVATALTITDALIERFGLLTIIVLGETVTGVVDGLAGQPVSGLTLSVGLVAVVVGFGAWWTYFDFAGHRNP
jgi:hypothetical protein